MPLERISKGMMPLAMQRVLEPEVMDHPADAEEYDAMDFLESDTRFAEDAVALLAGVASPRVVDLGTGTGTIPLLFLRRHPHASVVGVDLAQSMLSVARRKAESAGFANRVEWLLADVKQTALLGASFDLVMSNSTLHHIADPQTLLDEMARLARPGGALLLRDLARPPSVDAARAIVERVAPHDSDRQKQLFFDSLCAALTLEEVRTLAQNAGIEGARVEMVSDRHFTVERAA